MIEQETEKTKTAETIFEKVILNIFHDEPQLFKDVINTLKNGQDVLEIMAPADMKVYMTRIPGIGKLAVSVNNLKKMIEIVSTRSMEKEQIMQEEVTETIRNMTGSFDVKSAGKRNTQDTA